MSGLRREAVAVALATSLKAGESRCRTAIRTPRVPAEGASPARTTEVWYLLYAIQTGIGGPAVMGVLILAILGRLWRIRQRPWARAAMGIGFGLGAGALFIPIIEDPAVFTRLWATVGLALALEVRPGDRPRLILRLPFRAVREHGGEETLVFVGDVLPRVEPSRPLPGRRSEARSFRRIAAQSP